MSAPKNNSGTNCRGNPVSAEKTQTQAVQVAVPVHDLLNAWCKKNKLKLGETATLWLNERLRIEVANPIAVNAPKNNTATGFHGNPISDGKTQAVQVAVPVHKDVKAWCDGKGLPLGKTATRWLEERLRVEVLKALSEKSLGELVNFVLKD